MVPQVIQLVVLVIVAIVIVVATVIVVVIAVLIVVVVVVVVIVVIVVIVVVVFLASLVQVLPLFLPLPQIIITKLIKVLPIIMDELYQIVVQVNFFVLHHLNLMRKNLLFPQGQTILKSQHIVAYKVQIIDQKVQKIWKIWVEKKVHMENLRTSYQNHVRIKEVSHLLKKGVLHL